jgi:sulfur carrier protein ThiS
LSAIIRPMGQLRNFFNDQPTITVPSEHTVRETLAALQIQPELIAGVVVNGDLQSKDYTLRDEDDVKLFAVIGGG